MNTFSRLFRPLSATLVVPLVLAACPDDPPPSPPDAALDVTSDSAADLGQTETVEDVAEDLDDAEDGLPDAPDDTALDTAPDDTALDTGDGDGDDTGPADSGPSCPAPCENGGVCVEPGGCDCTGTGFTGETCAAPCGLACRICEDDGQRPVLEVADPAGDFRLVVSPDVDPAPLTVPASEGGMPTATALTHRTLPLAGFVAAAAPEPGADGAASHLRAVATRSGLAPVRQRAFQNWDGFDAVQATFRLPGPATLSAARAATLAALLGVEPDALAGLPPGPGDATESTHEAEITWVFRSAARVVAVGAAVPVEARWDAATRTEVAAWMGGAALAQHAERLEPRCEVMTIDAPPRLDVLIGMEDRASNAEAREALAGAADALHRDMTDLFVDARWAIHATDHVDAGNGNAAANVCGMTRDPLGAGGSVWVPFGEDTKADFVCRVRDPGAARDCAPPGDGTAATAGLECTELAVGYVQGASTVAGIPPARNRQRAGATLAHVALVQADDGRIASGAWDFDEAVAHVAGFFADPRRTIVTGAPFVPVAFFPGGGAAPAFERLYVDSPALAGMGGSTGAGDGVLADGLRRWLVAAAAAGTPHRTLSPAVPASVRVVVEPAGNAEPLELPHSADNGWELDGVLSALLFRGTARPPTGAVATIGFQSFTRNCDDPDGCAPPTPAR